MDIPVSPPSSASPPSSVSLPSSCVIAFTNVDSIPAIKANARMDEITMNRFLISYRF